MSIGKGVLKNTGYLVFSRLVPPGMTFILVLFIIRRLGAEILGAYDIVLSFLAVFQTVGTFGLKYLLIREVGKNREEGVKYLVHSCILSVPAGLVCSGVMYAAVVLLGYDQNIQYAAVLAVFALMATVMTDICEGLFTALEKVLTYAMIISVENMLRVAASISLIILGYGLLSLIVVLSLTRIFGLCLNLFFVIKVLPRAPFGFDRAFCLHLIRSARAFAVTAIMSSIYAKMDVFILSLTRTMAEVGIYTAAYRFINIAQMLLVSFNSNLYPVLSRLYHSSREQFGATCKKTIRHLLTIAFPLVILSSLVADQGITFLFGEDFSSSAQALKILIWTIIPFSFGIVVSFILLSTHNQKIDMKVNIFSVIANATLNLILIPRFGVMGAAFAAVLSTISYLLIQCRFLPQEIFSFRLHSVFGRPVVASIGMIAILLLFKSNHTAVAFVLSAMAYSAIIAVLTVYSDKTQKQGVV